MFKANKCLFTDTSGFMSRDPLSDDEVEADGSSYVRIASDIDNSVRKSMAVVKTYDWYFSGVPNLSVSGTTKTLYPFCHDYADAHNDFTGTISWIPFIPSVGPGKNQLIGEPSIVVDGVKASIYAWLPESLDSVLPRGDPKLAPRQRVFFELLYVRDPPRAGDDIGEGFVGIEYWRRFLYEQAKTIDQVWNVFLTKTAIASGVRSLKRWSFTLDREVYHETGHDFDNKYWWQVETGPLVYNGGNRVEGVIGLNEAVWAEVVGKKEFVQSYSGSSEANKGWFSAVQKIVDQPQSFWRFDDWINIKCSFDLSPPYSHESIHMYPSDAASKGCFLLACWSDVFPPTGAVPYPQIPQVEANFRFKFHQKH